MTRDADRRLGQVVSGRYKIERQIGAGSRSVVYEASDLHGDPAVAVKIQRSDLSDDDIVRKSFDREASVHAAVSYSHVPIIMDRGAMPDGCAYLVMSLLRGFTVAEALSIGGAPFGVEAALWILTDLCLGLRSAHEHGIVHGAVSPRSVMLARYEDSPGGELAFLINFAHATIADPKHFSARFDPPRLKESRRPPLQSPRHYLSCYASGAEATTSPTFARRVTCSWRCLQVIETQPPS